jgi:hypothetical protein
VCWSLPGQPFELLGFGPVDFSQVPLPYCRRLIAAYLFLQLPDRRYTRSVARCLTSVDMFRRGDEVR